MSDHDWAGEIVSLLPARRGHFRLESGHHGELWLDLERLFEDPTRLRPALDRLAQLVSAHAADLVCGPLIEGAFVGLGVAERLRLPFTYTAPREDPTHAGLFPVRYHLPSALRPVVAGKRVAIVNDVINAGSAVKGTLAELRACGARPIVIGTLAVLGPHADRLAAENGVALETLTTIPNEIWSPEECPLCARGAPLER